MKLRHRAVRCNWILSAIARIGLMAAGLIFPGLRSNLAAARPVEAAVNAVPQVPLPYSIQDNSGTQWVIQQDGCIGPGQTDIFNGGGHLFVGANQPYAPNVPTALYDAVHNELIFSVASIAGLNVSRRVAVDAKEGWCRWVEILENPSGSTIKTQVHINFDLAAAAQSTQNITDEKKTHKPMGLVVFDGNRGIALLGAGRGAAVSPVYAPQQGNDQVDVTWDVEAPAHKTIAIVHLTAIRPTVNDAQSFLGKISDRQVLKDLPPELVKGSVNFQGHSDGFGELELLRGDLQDIVELRGGDQYKGTVLEKSFSLQTAYGMVELPAEKVLAMLAVGELHHTLLLVTREGEAFGGILASQVIHLQLSSGQVTPIPITSIKRLGYRKQTGESDEFKYDHPMLVLRNGDRIAVERPVESIPMLTRYGTLLLKPQSISALVFQSEDQPVHELLLTDGSKIAGLIGKEALELRPLTIGTSKLLAFSVGSVSRFQITPRIEEPTEPTAMLSLSTGDKLVGALSGKLLLETAFDTIAIDGAEVRAMRHAGAAPAELQITLWDDATLSGRLKGDTLDMALKSGPSLHVPATLVDEYAQPNPLPPPSVLEKIRSLVTSMATDDWKRADRAMADLTNMGPRIIAALRTQKAGQSKAVQDRIDKVLAALEPPPSPPTAAPTTNPAPDQ